VEVEPTGHDAEPLTERRPAAPTLRDAIGGSVRMAF
jgi:hypothetical protein